MMKQLSAAAERGTQVLLLVLFMAIVPASGAASAAASGGEATPPSLAALVGDWLASGNNADAD